MGQQSKGGCWVSSLHLAAMVSHKSPHTCRVSLLLLKDKGSEISQWLLSQHQELSLNFPNPPYKSQEGLLEKQPAKVLKSFPQLLPPEILHSQASTAICHIF